MKKIKIAATIVLVLCLVGIIAILVFREKEYTGYEVVRELENSEISEYTVSDGKLIRCGTEGAQAVNGSGNLLWNITYSTMKNPQFVFCGEMTAIADIGAKTFLLADGSGVSHQYTTPYPIQWICVAKQGVTAVLMNGEGEFTYCPIFDQGAGLLSDTTMDYPLGGDTVDYLQETKAKTFCDSFDDQLDISEKLYGRQLKFFFTKKDVKELLDAATIYPEEVRKRVEDVIYLQMEKYGYLFGRQISLK